VKWREIGDATKRRNISWTIKRLTIRHGAWRLTSRVAAAAPKTFENLQAAVSLHFAHYNPVRLHKTLRVTPPMAAGVADHLWRPEELVDRTSK
jgi:hypothetical protein